MIHLFINIEKKFKVMIKTCLTRGGDEPVAGRYRWYPWRMFKDIIAWNKNPCDIWKLKFAW